MLTKHINRRRFLTATAKAAAITIVPRQVLGGQGHTPPSEKLNIAGSVDRLNWLGKYSLPPVFQF